MFITAIVALAMALVFIALWRAKGLVVAAAVLFGLLLLFMLFSSLTGDGDDQETTRQPDPPAVTTPPTVSTPATPTSPTQSTTDRQGCDSTGLPHVPAEAEGCNPGSTKE